MFISSLQQIWTEFRGKHLTNNNWQNSRAFLACFVCPVYYIVSPLRTELTCIEIENTIFFQQDCEQAGFQEHDITHLWSRGPQT